MGLSYVLMLIAFYVDNGKQLPIWKDLPHFGYCLLLSECRSLSAHCCGIRSHAMSLRTNARGHVGLGATQDLFYAAIGLTSQQPAVADAVCQVTAATRWMRGP
jgi:hypothetical protein